MRSKRPETATKEKHEVAMRSDTPRVSLFEYSAADIRVPSMVISRKMFAPN